MTKDDRAAREEAVGSMTRKPGEVFSFQFGFSFVFLSVQGSWRHECPPIQSFSSKHASPRLDNSEEHGMK